MSVLQQDVSRSASRATLTVGNLLRNGLLGGIVAAVGNLVLYFVARGLFAVPFLVPAQGNSSELMALTPAMVIIASIVPAIAAALFLAVLARFVTRPIWLFQIIGAVLMVLSLGAPLTLPVALATRIVLALMHLIAGGVIIGALSRTARD